MPYAPVLHEHPIVKRIWRTLSDRCEAPGTQLTDDADLHLLADGERLDAVSVGPSLWRFRLRAPVSDLRIASRCAVPSMLGIDQDQRQLGVAVRRIVLAQFGLKKLTLSWDDPRLRVGFHAPEPAQQHRWTDGEAVLPPRLLAPFGEGAIVELYISGRLLYPMVEAPARDRAVA
jgi:hypothetical protein